MRKVLKTSIILVLLLTFFASFSVFAAEKTNAVEQNTVSNSAQVEKQQESTSSLNAPAEKSAVQVSSVKQKDDGSLSVSDILNILLIATGIVLILLAIAILIKAK